MTSTASSRGPASRSKGCWANSARCSTAPAGVRVYRLSSPSRPSTGFFARAHDNRRHRRRCLGDLHSGRSGGAQVEQVYATELDALRANKHNTDGNRRVRFLPYGIAVGVLDEPTVISDSEITDSEITDEE